jgi:hypothetical protein
MNWKWNYLFDAYGLVSNKLHLWLYKKAKQEARRNIKEKN